MCGSTGVCDSVAPMLWTPNGQCSINSASDQPAGQRNHKWVGDPRCMNYAYYITISPRYNVARNNAGKIGPASEILDNFRHGPTPNLDVKLYLASSITAGATWGLCVHTRANTTRCKQAARYNWIEEVSRLLCPRTYHRVRWGFGWMAEENYLIPLIFL